MVWSSREQGYPEGPSLEEEKQSRRRAAAQAAILCETGHNFSFVDVEKFIPVCFRTMASPTVETILQQHDGDVVVAADACAALPNSSDQRFFRVGNIGLEWRIRRSVAHDATSFGFILFPLSARCCISCCGPRTARVSLAATYDNVCRTRHSPGRPIGLRIAFRARRPAGIRNTTRPPRSSAS